MELYKLLKCVSDNHREILNLKIKKQKVNGKLIIDLPPPQPAWRLYSLPSPLSR